MIDRSTSDSGILPPLIPQQRMQMAMEPPKKGDVRPDVDVFWCGGTIASIEQIIEGKPQLLSLLDFEQFRREFIKKLDEIYDFHEQKITNMPPTGYDSTNITETAIIDIGAAVFKVIREKYSNGAENANGVIVSMGTDTTEMVAAHLAFSIFNPHHPIVFTGAQIKPDSGDSDAQNNFSLAARVATTDLTEVAIAFAPHVLRGSSAKKEKAVAKEPFDTPHHQPLGELYGEVFQFLNEVSQPRRRSNMTADELLTAPQYFPNLSGNSVIIDMTPKLADPVNLEQELFGRTQPLDGVVIAGYAAGNIPTQCKKVLEKASEKMTVIICPRASTRGMPEAIYSTSPKVSQPHLIYAEGVPPYIAELKFRKLHARASILKHSINQTADLKGQWADKDMREWIRSRFILPLSREIPLLREGGRYVSATVVMNLLNVRDSFEQALIQSGTSEDIQIAHDSMILNKRRKFLDEEGRGSARLPMAERLPWVHERDALNIPVQIRGDKAVPRDRVSKHFPDNTALERIWKSPDLIGSNPVESISRICNITQEQASAVLQEWGHKDFSMFQQDQDVYDPSVGGIQLAAQTSTGN